MALSSAAAARSCSPPDLDWNLLVSKNSLEAKAVDSSRKQSPTKNRLGGDPGELHQTLEACLKVNRFERATALLRRLTHVYPLDAPELITSYNLYLLAMVEHIIKTRSNDYLKTVQKWFEVELRGKGIRPNATTYALLIKASLQVLQGPKIERTIRRYMDLAGQTQHEIEVLNLPILSDNELFKVTEICPTEFHNARGVLQAAENDPHHPEFQSSMEDIPKETQEKPLPEIRSADQKGLGLEALKKSISVFSDSSIPYPEGRFETGAAKDEAYLKIRQERLEHDAISSAIDRWRDESRNLQKLGLNTALRKKSFGSLMWDWQESLLPVIQRELNMVEKTEAKGSTTGSDHDRCIYGPLLRLLPQDKLAAVTILSTMSAISLGRLDRGIKISSLIMTIGSSVQDEIITHSFQRKDTKQIWGHLSIAERRQKLAKLIRKRSLHRSLTKLFQGGNTSDVDTLALGLRPWDNVTRAKVGATLLSALIETSKIPVTRENPETHEQITKLQPAFYHTYRHLQGKRIGFVGAHAQLTHQLMKEPVHYGLAKNLPMIVEPRKWTSVNSGGYLSTPVKVMRIKGDDMYQNQYIKAAAQKGDLEQVFGGLDVLAKTAWKINSAILEVMLRVWNTGEELANIPPEDPQLSYPVEPDPSADPVERIRWIKAVKEVENTRSGYHSQRCFQNFQLEIARAFRNEKLYFPHSLDFRGRAYPVPPHLNHMGADNCRGLLMFAESRELGANGLNWLKVHLANLYGYDKASFHERARFTMDHLNDIYDSANKPLEGQRWWLKAEDPWQCLAACMELKNALDSPDPVHYKSQLPIHQDGTCNGLQHYAALGGDILGAKQVNLEPGDRPVDVYTGVAEIVKAEISKDAKKGLEVAKVLEGKITRKVVKQTVMTNVYGVTFAGASAQVRKQLMALMPEYENPQGLHFGLLSSYIAKKIFKALSTMFGGAREIQYWLGQCASRITVAITPEQMQRLEDDYNDVRPNSLPKKLLSDHEKSLDEHTRFLSTLIWTTPLKMPVVQPYRGTKSRKVISTLQIVRINDPRASDPVDKRRQLQAFPPNFIHSLDATHMLLSALQCDEMGLTFAAVHDSFWTHAADVDKMNVVLRNAFVRIHAEDVIGRLEIEFKARYKGQMYAARVPKNTPLAGKIRAWRESHWGKSQMRADRHIEELLLERKRMQLIQSSDPKEREKGRLMVTPGSLFEKSTDRRKILPPEEFAGHGIGEFRGQVSPSNSSNETSHSDEGSVPISDPEQEPDSGLGNEGDGSDKEDLDAQIAVEEEGKESKTKSSGQAALRVWLPLTFPPKPAKGKFDIQRLKDSQYFFS
ncbi:MAG: DNA-directed RNA polymerase [Sclerophora amabilis]|nr:MAG: DNA-directed RNA polymerase [Sclerophora amabilis]